MEARVGRSIDPGVRFWLLGKSVFFKQLDRWYEGE